MHQLTCRRNDDTHREGWAVMFGDVQVGIINQRAGTPNTVPLWQWHCGFYPVSHKGIRAAGIAATFDDARVAFEAAWAIIRPQCTEADFTEHREERAFVTWKYRMWDAGCRPDTDAGRQRHVEVFLRRADQQPHEPRAHPSSPHGAAAGVTTEVALALWLISNQSSATTLQCGSASTARTVRSDKQRNAS
jgi:hypothetical protein